MYGQSSTKEARRCNGQKTVFSKYGAGKTGQLHVKRMKLEHSLTPYKKINSKYIKDLNVRLGHYKTLKRKTKAEQPLT